MKPGSVWNQVYAYDGVGVIGVVTTVEDRFGIPWNATLSIIVTLDGMVMEVRDVHP